MWNTAFKVGGAACLVSVNGCRHPASKAQDQHGNRFCRVAERVGREFVSLQLDRVELLSSQCPAVKDEEEFVALVGVRCSTLRGPSG